MTIVLNKADPLFWGTGDRMFEMFLEPTCPYSVRAFGKMDALLAHAGADRITVKVRLHSQPWHMYSDIVIRCILAASMLEGGRENAKRVLEVVGEHRMAFEFEGHCKGPVMDVTPREIIGRLEEWSGMALAEAFEFPALTAEVKWHAKYSRQNGIHVSPTFMIDGLIHPNIGSGDSVEDWAKQLLA